MLNSFLYSSEYADWLDEQGFSLEGWEYTGKLVHIHKLLATHNNTANYIHNKYKNILERGQKKFS